MNAAVRRRGGAIVASLAMAFIWGSAAFLKALDPPAFAEQIRLHHVSPEAWSLALAYLFIAVETLLAAAHLTFFRPRLAFAGSIALLAVFMGVTGVAWAMGNTEGCGCFGRLAARSPRDVLTEDSGFLAIAVIGFLFAGRLRTPRFSRVAFPAL